MRMSLKLLLVRCSHQYLFSTLHARDEPDPTADAPRDGGWTGWTQTTHDTAVAGAKMRIDGIARHAVHGRRDGLTHTQLSPRAAIADVSLRP